MKVYGISFKDNGKIYDFSNNIPNIDINDYVIVETEKGEQIGKVINITEKEPEKELKQILKKATKEDYNKYLKNLKDAKNVEQKAKELAENLELPMQIIDASYTFDRKQLTINFIADERIDFRELVKQLAAIYKTRIDLHQIGIRDKAREKGGIGPCGRQICCNSFLNRLDTITINMAKNQNIALNPTKINGACGRLLCCLSYEDETYCELRKDMPSIGVTINYEGKEYKVINVDILNRTYTINYENEKKEIKLDEK